MSHTRKPPLVTGISPNEGISWTKVTIRGENLGVGPTDLIGKAKKQFMFWYVKCLQQSSFRSMSDAGQFLIICSVVKMLFPCFIKMKCPELLVIRIICRWQINQPSKFYGTPFYNEFTLWSNHIIMISIVKQGSPYKKVVHYTVGSLLSQNRTFLVINMQNMNERIW